MSFPDEQVLDKELVEKLDLKMHDYLKEGVTPPPQAQVMRFEGHAKNPDSAPVETNGGEYAPRRARITKVDLEEHGFTTGCPACLSAQLGDGIRRGGHNEQCRARLEDVMSKDKMDRAKGRIDQWTAEKVEKETAQTQGEQGEDQTARGSGLSGEDRKKAIAEQNGDRLEDAPVRSPDRQAKVDASHDGRRR